MDDLSKVGIFLIAIIVTLTVICTLLYAPNEVQQRAIPEPIGLLRFRN
jgi:hypothetical protein